jgi:neutral ceramidase
VGIPASNIIVAATHTHGGPLTFGRPPFRTDVSDYIAHVSEAAVTAVAGAYAHRGTARLLAGTGVELAVARNRRRPGGVTDPAVPIVRVESLDGQILGLLCSYACHPVAVGPDNHLVTADYPGEVVRTLEAVYPGAMAIFATGCAGQINTGHSAWDSLSTEPDPTRSFAEMRRLGRIVAAAAIRTNELVSGPRGKALAAAPCDTRDRQVAAATLKVSAPRQPIPSSHEFASTAARWRSVDSPTADEGQLRRWADWAEQMSQVPDHAAEVPLEVTSFRWGDIVLVGLPGEPFVELGQEIKRRAVREPIIIGYANGCPGYVPHRSAYAEGGYEVLHAHKVYGAPTAFAPEAGELLTEAALKGVATLCRDERVRVEVGSTTNCPHDVTHEETP